ncbi:MAG: hypothetical protein U9Q69_05820 [Nanoarchaeota archaeon]|nr:hypothetical protein [Nanoarchaeota archaeon]
MVKCKICGKKIEKIFLGKIMGTQIGKDYVCSLCQKKYKDKIKDKL